MSGVARAKNFPEVLMYAYISTKNFPEALLYAYISAKNSPGALLYAYIRAKNFPEVLLYAYISAKNFPEVLLYAYIGAKNFPGVLATPDIAPRAPVLFNKKSYNRRRNSAGGPDRRYIWSRGLSPGRNPSDIG